MSAMNARSAAGTAVSAEATCAPGGRALWLPHQLLATQAAATQPASTRRQPRQPRDTGSGQSGRCGARLAQQMRERHATFCLLSQQGEKIIGSARLAEQAPLPE